MARASRTREPRSREEQSAAREERIAAAQALLEGAVAEICSGEDWRRYLELQGRLHAYSASNVVLIATQHARAFAEGRVATPSLSYVAGYGTWRALGRAVEKGQHGYAILAPLRYSVSVDTDSAGATRVLCRGDGPGPGESVTARPSLRGFVVEHVFALEQTTGEELATPPRPRLLVGSAPPGLFDAMVELVGARGFGVSLVSSADAIGGANGRTDFGARTVVVRADIDDAARAKTLLHETAHVLLHDPVSAESVPRFVREVEAKSVAFVVASAHGMATDEYSFPYVAAWAGRDGVDVVRQRAQRVARVARELLEASPAPHGTGGRVPGVEHVLEQGREALREVSRHQCNDLGHELSHEPGNEPETATLGPDELEAVGL